MTPSADASVCRLTQPAEVTTKTTGSGKVVPKHLKKTGRERRFSGNSPFRISHPLTHACLAYSALCRLISFSYLLLSLAANLFPSGLRIKVQDVSVFSHTHATYPAHLILLDILFNCALQNYAVERRKTKWLYLRRTGEMPAEFWWANLKERDHLEVIPLHGTIILKWILNKWSRVASFCEHVDERWGICRPGEKLLDSQKEICCVVLLRYETCTGHTSGDVRTQDLQARGTTTNK